ncbi:hypothetical protein [Formosa sp. S-31]|uniref:hypothetical protein n=1 Tax=Formosa sp. S-31 TaxID=2790949 RepID=UPI003EBF9058
MTSTDFTYILQHPEALSAKQTEELQTVLNEFPYFQPARALFLKGLKKQDSFKYNQELKTTAAYTTDRSILFDFITSEVFLQNEISEYIKQNAEHIKDIEVDAVDLSVNKKTSIDDSLTQQIEETEGVLDPELFQPKVTPSKIDAFTLEKTLSPTPEVTNTEESIETQATASDSPETILEIGKPLKFDKSETHSFNEWLKLAKFNPIDRSNPSQEDESSLNVTEVKPEEPAKPTPKPCPEKAKKFELIDKFISSSPKIDPKKSTSTTSHNLAESHMIQPESLMTETLARIYVEQKNYKKAIQSYNILSLKYPEKSGFFADRIKAIKKIQEQNNKN